MSWLQLRIEGMHFILSDNNYDFDVKVGHCGFVGFVYINNRPVQPNVS